LESHLQAYGHTIYNLDFASPTPADDPAPVLETLKLYVGGQGADPHLRQQASTEKREQSVQATLARLGGLVWNDGFGELRQSFQGSRDYCGVRLISV